MNAWKLWKNSLIGVLLWLMLLPLGGVHLVGIAGAMLLSLGDPEEDNVLDAACEVQGEETL